MGKLKSAIMLSFRTKVLVPVVAVMILLIATTNWLVNQRVTGQLQADAARMLTKDAAVVRRLQYSRSRDLLKRFNSIKNEPRLKAAASMFDPNREHLPGPERQATIEILLTELIKDEVADAISFVPNGAAPSTITQDPRLKTEFEAAAEGGIAEALNGTLRVRIAIIGDRLFDLYAVPILIGDRIVGAVTFGVENALAQEFNQYTDSELIFHSDGQILSSALRRPTMQPFLEDYLARLPARKAGENRNSTEKLEVGGEHYLVLAGNLDSGSNRKLGYLILSSYERQLGGLRDTQSAIMLVGGVAILLGAIVIWYFVHRVVGPLEELRDSVEAVGQGDLTRRIEVSSMDECGELAEVFNQMTENIRLARERLEATVETLKTTQAQLIQSEKLSGIGQFVAGVAHELNNPLTSVMGFSELLQQGEVNPQQKRHLEMIHKSALRCQKIVQSLLSFSRRRQPERKLVCVNSLVEAAVEILNYQLRTSNIDVTSSLDPRLPQAMVDPHQIQQVFLNIINNARQAIETHRPKGAIRISSDTCGTNVRVIFSDNGPGIPEANLSKVFDPFFTTKEVGKGTGLGLSLCYGIVREHGGTIKVGSKAGQGATFTVELPIAAPASDQAGKKDVPLILLPNPNEGAGRKVLVIDDEEAILQMVSEALSRSGYAVDVATDGETALKQVGQRSYDLALCDWKMPGLTGEQIYERLRVANPKLSERMIFITGDVVNEKTQEFLLKQNKVCLSKPFSLAEFRSAVNKALAGK